MTYSLRRALVAAASLTVFASIPSAAAGLAYVSNQSGPVAVVDTDTLAVVGHLQAGGKETRGIGMSSDGRFIVTANRDDGSVTIHDRASGKVLRRVKVGRNPEFVRVRGALAYVSFEPSSDGKPPPSGAAASAAAGASASSMASAASAAHGKDDDDEHAPARIAVVEIARGKLLRTIVAGMETEGIEFSADGRDLIVTNEATDTIGIHRLPGGKLVQTIDVAPQGKRPRGIKASPNGQYYVSTLEFGNAFIVLDRQYRIVRKVETGQSPYGVAFDRSGKRLFVAASRSKALQVFDTGTWEKIQDVPIGERCWHFSFTSDGARILVACGRSSEVLAIDAQTLEPAGSVPDAQLPWGIVTWPRSPGSLD